MTRTTYLRVALAAASTAAVVVLMVSPFVTRSEANEAPDLATLRFGWPVAFVVQDQSHTNPPLPHLASLLSPLEFGTGIDYPRLLAAAVLLFAPAAGIAMRSTRSETRAEDHDTIGMSPG